MPRQNTNSTKISILGCLSDGHWWTTREVAETCKLSLSNASELMRRYRNQGLVNRVRNRDVPRGYLYCINDVGLERLEYLSSGEMETSSAVADLAGLSGTKKSIFGRWVKQRLGR